MTNTETTIDVNFDWAAAMAAPEDPRFDGSHIWDSMEPPPEPKVFPTMSRRIVRR